MFRNLLLKEIKGRVFDDADSRLSDSQRAGALQGKGLPGVTVKLYRVCRVETGRERTPGSEMSICKERYVCSEKTDANGNFKFLVKEGRYSVGVDIETFPLGKGVLEPNRFVHTGIRNSCDFAVRDVARIEAGSKLAGRVQAVDEYVLNPVFRDKDGNVLAAKAQYTTDNGEARMEGNQCRVTWKTLDRKEISVTIDAGNVKAHYPILVELPEMCPAGRIYLAHRVGMIDEHKRTLLHMLALFDRDRLPEEYRSRMPVKNATSVIQDIQEYIKRKDADRSIAETAKQYLGSIVPKLDRVYTSPNGYFRIHYTLSGENAVQGSMGNSGAVPPYIKLIGSTFDHIRSATCEERGFRAPIPESGEEAFHVYVYDLKGKYGVTYASETYQADSRSAPRASCYICIDNDYSPSKGFDKTRDDAMKVTAAHEFFHAVQYAYNVEADSWWKEATASWYEDEIYTGINDYVRYVEQFYASPHRTLEESSYGGVVFAKYLSEYYGGYRLIKRIWEIQSALYKSSINAIDRAISERYKGKDIGTAFDRFTAYNFNPTQYYEEGSLWKTAASVQNTYINYPVAAAKGKLKHLAADYQLLKADPAAPGKPIRIIVDGEDRARWGFKLQKRKQSDGLCELIEIESDGAFGRAEITVNGLGDAYSEVCLIPANLEKDRDDLAYTYSVSVDN